MARVVVIIVIVIIVILVFKMLKVVMDYMVKVMIVVTFGRWLP